MVLMRILLAISITALVAAVVGRVALAHDQDECEGHFLEDVQDGPPGRYLLYAHSSHDHLVVKPGSGVSSVSVSRVPNTFDYQGIEITVDDLVFKITYRTTRVGAVVLICFEGTYGSWYPISLDEPTSPPPTPEPTAIPTDEPTPEPTATPTAEPTTTPTRRPTTTPTRTPTPTRRPTPTPTPRPTREAAPHTNSNTHADSYTHSHSQAYRNINAQTYPSSHP